MTEKLLIFPQRLFTSGAIPPVASDIVLHDVADQLKVRLISLFDDSGLANQADRVWERPFGVAMNLLASLTYAGAQANWMEAAFYSSINGPEQLLRRLKRDLPDIRKHFFDGVEPGTLTAVACGLSDPHHHGASVSVLTFSSGKKLVYKPRDMEIEAWFFDLTAWMQHAGAPLPVRAMQVLPRKNYGWMEFTEHMPCCNEEQLRNFYRNAGALLCLLHILLATDCHLENIIAFGELPIVVDVETVFQPQCAGENDPPSPVRTGMLPRWTFGPAGQAYDLSALGCVSPRLTHIHIPTANGNRVEFAPAALIPSTNVPFQPGHDANPGLYAEEIEDGFKLTYRFLSANRTELLAIIQKAVQKRIRLVPRDTLEYYQALSAVLLAGSDEIDLREFQPPRSSLESLHPDELIALGQLDIPRFTLEAGSRNLNGAINVFPVSGCEAACALIKSSEENYERSIEAVRASWAMYRIARSLGT